MNLDNAERSFISGHHSPCADLDTDSEVEYPLIDLKTGLKNELIEKTLRDLKKISNKSKDDFPNRPKDISHRLLGQFRSTQFAMSRAIDYYFSEQEYILEKMKRAQLQTLRDLNRIHLNKRKQMRMSYEYHNEELRRSIARMKEEAAFQRQQEQIEEAMKQEKRNINKLILEQKNIIEETKSKPKKKFGRKAQLSPIEKDISQTNSRTMENSPIENIPIKTTEDNPLILELSKSRSFLQTKALEVTKDFSKPRTLERDMNERVISNIQIVPNIDKQKDSEEHESLLVTEMKEAKTNDGEDSKNIQIPNSPYDDIKLPKDISEKTKFRSPKEIMKQRKIKREKEFQDILALPFIAYRRNREGKIVELDHPPTLKEFKEPSNKGKYKMRKLLDEERNHYQDSIENLTKTTDNIIQEENRRIRLLNAPKHEMQRKSIQETRAIGPEHWMKAFVSSNIPNDIDPSSTEAIIYCRYIRAPLESYSHLPNYLLYHTPL